MESKRDENVFVFYSGKVSHKAEKGKFFIEGDISTTDVDLVNDVVTKNCLDSMFDQFDTKTLKLDFEHEAFRGKTELESQLNKTKIPLGKAIDRSKTANSLKVRWELNSTWQKFDEKGNVTMTFKDLWKNVEEGFYDAFSIAYIPTKSSRGQRNGQDIRLLDDLNLLNVALTGNPVNTTATITSVMAKSLDYLEQKNRGDNMAEKKDYEEDGKHVHTEEKPMGEHTHPEIEKHVMFMRDEMNELRSMIFEMRNHMSDLNGPEEASMTMKGHKKEDDDDDSKKRYKKKYKKTKEGENIMVNKKDEEVEKPAEDAAPEAEQPEDVSKEESSEEAAPAAEGKSEDMIEVKAQIVALQKSLETKDEEIKALQEIVNKPIVKSLGAESKDKIEGQVAEGNAFKGPMDLI